MMGQLGDQIEDGRAAFVIQGAGRLLLRRSVVSSPRESPEVGVPSMITWPLSALIRVAATASRLDLPEPDGPMTAVMVPLSTSRLTGIRVASRWAR